MQKAILLLLGLLAVAFAQQGTTGGPTGTTSGGSTGSSSGGHSGSTPAGTTPLPGSSALPPSSSGTTTTRNPNNPIAPTTNPKVCKFEDRAWGAPDLRAFYICPNGVPLLIYCNEGTFFESSPDFFGCAPPAAINSNCINQNVEVGPCTGNNVMQPQVSEDPGYFWMCKPGNDYPDEVPCPDDLAFIKQDGYMGCISWEMWREMRDCSTY